MAKAGRKPNELLHKQILRMHRSRLPLKAIARHVGCSRNTVRKVVRDTQKNLPAAC